MNLSLSNVPCIAEVMKIAKEKLGGDPGNSNPRSATLIRNSETYPLELFSLSYRRKRLAWRIYKGSEARDDLNKLLTERKASLESELKNLDICDSMPLPAEQQPPPFLNLDNKPHWFLRNLKGEIVAIQTREITPSGERKFLYQTYWSDTQWRTAEPSQDIPVFVPGGLDELKSARTIFVHEGAKAAQAAHDIANDETSEHPWKEELSAGIHIGWTGGANSAHKNDWRMIQVSPFLEQVIIVPDNDLPGRNAVTTIAKALNVPTYRIMFDSSFPEGFDIADNWPKNVSTPMDRITFPATWLTDQKPIIENGKRTAKKKSILRKSAQDAWHYVENISTFVCAKRTDIRIRHGKNKPEQSRHFMPFSHTPNDYKLLCGSGSRPILDLTYLPGVHETVVRDKLNVWIPSDIKPNTLGRKLWLDFLEYLVTDKDERYQLQRWVATLLARPTTRMGFGCLLITNKHGIGKTTLGKIISKILGTHNTSFPNGSDFEGTYNAWCCHKQLCVVNEIYEGKGYKVYHKLKSVMTDETVTVHEKYIPEYSLDVKVHILACSNSDLPLKIENSDRRWMVPKLTETRWPDEMYVELYEWLERGGYGAILQWALEFKDYVKEYEHAPMSAIKQRIIQDSISLSDEKLTRIANKFAETESPRWVYPLRVKDHFQEYNLPHVPTITEIEKIFQRQGAMLHSESFTIEGISQSPLLNKAAIKLAKTSKFSPTDWGKYEYDLSQASEDQEPM